MSATITEGEALFTEGRIDEAQAYFENILQSQPKSKEALNNLGVIAYRNFTYGKAAGYFARALEIDPFYREAVINLCDVLRDTGNLGQAINLLEIVTVKYPDDVELNSLAREARTLAQPTEASPEKQIIPQQVVSPDSQNKLSPNNDILNMRVLQGTYEIANQSYTIAEALKNKGMFAKTVCYYPNYLKYKSDYIFDLTRCANKEEAIRKSLQYAKQMIPQFDIFHFHFGTTLAYDYSDLPLLREQHKKVVTQYWGSDVRMLSVAQKINPYIKVKGKSEESIKRELEAMSKYVSHCIVGDYELYEYVKEYFEHIHVVPALIDTDVYKPDPNLRPNDKFLIIHAPTDSDIKGSLYIEQALNELSESYDFEYRLIKGMSHEEAMKNYRQADLIIDELHAGCYGLLSIETMAMEKPVITWISDFMKEKYPKELPIMPANPDTIKETVRYALENREMLIEKGKQGREYVKKYHDMNKVAGQIMGIYKKL